MTTRPETCGACVADPKVAPGRYCAPLRCLCGHPACPAYPTWVPVRRSAGPVTLAGLDHPDRLTARALAAAARAERERWRDAPHPDVPDRLGEHDPEA